MGPLPFPRSSIAARAPEIYSFALSTEVSRSNPFARFDAMALERVQPVPWVFSVSTRGARSHVLEAMGLPAQVIDGAIRVGLSRYTTEQEIDALCDALRSARESLAHA